MSLSVTHCQRISHSTISESHTLLEEIVMLSLVKQAALHTRMLASLPNSSQPIHAHRCCNCIFHLLWHPSSFCYFPAHVDFGVDFVHILSSWAPRASKAAFHVLCSNGPQWLTLLRRACEICSARTICDTVLSVVGVRVCLLPMFNAVCLLKIEDKRQL